MVLTTEQPIIAGLYCRISREDDSIREASASIEHQKQKLIDFAGKSDMHIYDIFCDDGYSGTHFKRPAFINLMEAIETKKINCVVVKDLSRLGREYIQSGQILENFFPKYNTRFIAIDDNIDLDPSSDTNNNSMLIPFFNMINEFYPADISKKTRSALRTKAQNGEFLSSYAPYGYIKCPSNKHKLLLDEQTCGYVRMIFDKAIEGWSLSRIARYLHDEKIPTPSDKRKGLTLCNWSSSTVRVILCNETYAGKVVYGKTRHISYKNKTVMKVPPSKWIVTPDAHSAIVSEEEFLLAAEYLKVRKRTTSSGAAHLFTGKLKCPDCGNMMNFCREKRKNNDNEGYYVCRTNKQFGNNSCSRHYIRYSVLTEAVRKELALIHALALANKEKMYHLILTKQESSLQQLRNDLLEEADIGTQRLNDINRIFTRLYSDLALDKITEEQYDIVQKELSLEKIQLTDMIEKNTAGASLLIFNTDKLDEFINLLLSFQNIEELTALVVASLIDYIEVFDKSVNLGVKQQIVKIVYKEIGCFRDVDVYG